jgi:hypothetical protein
MAAKADGIKAPRVTAWILQTSIICEILATLILFLAQIAFTVPQYFAGTMPSVLALAQIASRAFYALIWITLLMTMLWSGLANRATSALIGRKLECGPVMAAFWYIVPIASLWKPWQMMSEMYAANRDRAKGGGGKRHEIVTAWWVTRIAGGVLAVIAFVVLRTGNGSNLMWIQAIRAASMLDLTLLLTIVTRITQWQSLKTERVRLAELF